MGSAVERPSCLIFATSADLSALRLIADCFTQNDRRPIMVESFDFERLLTGSGNFKLIMKLVLSTL